MTAPDSDADSKPHSGPISPEALAAGQRTLAAIVFTDVVGFSKLMREDEDRTLRLVARDFDRMRATCESFGGQVQKSTGDGLLMLFTSAVQAVACALEIQRDVQKRNLDLPKNEQLQHRIGIHLGDIFQHGNDVMGDGVNVAARLQTEAVPGGICLSKTVYDVVNNRLPFYVNDLGERKLKNIGTVTAYQISPVEGGVAGRFFGLAWYRWRSWVWRGAVVLVLLLVLTFVFKLGQKRQLSHEQLQRLAQQLDPSGPGIAPSPRNAPSADPGHEAPFQASGTYPEPGKIAASDAEFEIARFNYMKKYDFASMSAWLQKYDSPDADETSLNKVCTSMRNLFDWCQVQLQGYSAPHPLVVYSDHDGQECDFWPEISGGVMLKTANGTLMLPKDQVPPLAMAGIAAQLIREKAPPGAPATLDLWQGLRYFIEAYHVKISPRWQDELDRIPAPQEVASSVNDR